MKIKKLKITVDQVSTMTWLHSFIKESTQDMVDSRNDYLEINSETEFEIIVQTTEKIALDLWRKNLNMVVEEVLSA
jgi:hypothetical protein